MKFRYFDVSSVDDSTGDGYFSTYCPSLKMAKEQALKAVKADTERREYDEEAMDEDSPPKITKARESNTTIQEVTLSGTPTQIAAAALVAAGGECEWAGDGSGGICYGRRWHVTLGGKLILTSQSISDDAEAKERVKQANMEEV